MSLSKIVTHPEFTIKYIQQHTLRKGLEILNKEELLELKQNINYGVCFVKRFRFLAVILSSMKMQK